MISLFRAAPVTTEKKTEKNLDAGKGRTLNSLVHHELQQKIAASTAFSLRAELRAKTEERLKEFTIGSLLKWRETVLKNEETTKTTQAKSLKERKTMKRSINQNPTTYKDSLKPALLAIGLMAVAGASLVQTTANAGERPLSDFLSRQGTYCLHLDSSGNPDCAASGYGGSGCFIQAPPSPNFVDWTDPFNNSSVSFDYAGLANTALGGTLGTSVDGMINEVVRTDGSVITTVLLQTKNALTWAHTNIGVTLPGTAPLLFGQRPAAVASGAQPSLGSCTLKVVLQGTAQNLPLPDLLELVFCSSPTWSLVSISFSGQADGTLPNGTPGQLQVTEVGLIALFVKQAFVLGVPSRVALDAFPAEHINIQATGK